ncbi:unnamed protein product, partial [Brassica napus]
GVAQALQVWVYTALPELGATFGKFLPNNPSPPILAYKGCKGRRQFKEAILSQTRVINFVQKDTGEMFPKWEFDVEDTLAENIIKLMFPAVVSPAKKKASEEAPAEASEEEIKYLSERVEAVEKKVSITTKRKGTSSQNTTSPPKPTLEPGVSYESSPHKRLTRQNTHWLLLFEMDLWLLLVKVLMGRTREGRAWRRIKVQMCPQLCPQMLVPRKIKLQNGALRRMLDIRKRGMLLWHFAQSPYTANSTARKLKELADWLKTCPHYRTTLDKKP